jgi:hypothetical protein
LLAGGDPKFSKTAGTLHISWPLTTVKGSLEMDMSENQIKITLVSKQKLDWFFDLNTVATSKLPFEKVGANKLDCKFEDINYSLKAVKGAFSTPDNGAVLRLKPQLNGIVLNLSDIN